MTAPKKKIKAKPRTKAAPTMNTITPQYDVINADLTLRQIRREITEFAIRSNICLDAMRDETELRRTVEEVGRFMALELSTRIATKKYAAKTVRFPTNWRQGFKIELYSWLLAHGCRRLHKWMTAKFPIHYTEVTLEASAYHPDVEIPNNSTFVEILDRARGYY